MKQNKIIISMLAVIILLQIYSTFIKQNKVEVQTVVQQNKLPNENFPKEESMIPKKEVNPYKNADLKVKIIDAEGGTFCYDILLNNGPIIHQPSIPGLPGNAGFKTKEQAKKVAMLALSKIQKNIIPPTISVEELDSLQVLNK